MSISRSLEIQPAIVPAGRLSTAIKSAFAAVAPSIDADALTASVNRRLPDGSLNSQQNVLLREVETICDLTEPGLMIQVSESDEKREWYYLAMYGGPPREASLHASTPSAGATERILDAAAEALGVSPYTPERPEPTPTETDRSAEGAPTPLPRPAEALGSPPRLRAFISYRIKLPENEAAVTILQQFLELENVEVLTGRSYEPRPLHEKIGDRLVGLDLLILLVGPDGESA